MGNIFSGQYKFSFQPWCQVIPFIFGLLFPWLKKYVHKTNWNKTVWLLTTFKKN